MQCWQLGANQHLIVKYEPMSVNAICSTLVGGVLMAPLYQRTANVAQENYRCI